MTGSYSHGASSEDAPQELLAAARSGDQHQLGRLLQLYHDYLTILATTQLDARLRRRISPSDLVQEAMLGAYRDFSQFRGQTERELLGWLRQILIHCLHHAYETHIKAGRRDLRREVSFEHVRTAFDGASPLQLLDDHERAVALMGQMAKLKPDYRTVIMLRNLQELSFEEVAERMGRKAGTVRMLWLRAIAKLKQLYESSSPADLRSRGSDCSRRKAV
jgi:RNA polymerase sigma-70 factor (ECF subfamily)